MFLRHRKQGDCWYSDFVHQGERHIKSWGCITKTVAKQKDRKYRTEVMEGKHTSRAKRVTFEKFAEKYLEYAVLNKKPKSAKRNEVSINALMPYFKGKLIGSIHPFMLEQYKKSRREEGRARGTVNRELDTIKNMMGKAVEWGYLTKNPLRDVKRFREDNEQMWVLTPEEEEKLLGACAKSPQRGGQGKRYLRDLVLFALHSGMREQEIFNLRKERVDLNNRFLVVVDTKNHEDRRVPINDTLKEIVERRMKDEGSEYLFHNSRGGRLTVLTSAFWNAVKLAKLVRSEVRGNETEEVRFRFHDCRHTFGSRLGMAGKDLKTIMEIMGHKTTRVALHYQHPMPSHKLEAVRALDEVPSKFTTEEKSERKVVNISR